MMYVEKVRSKMSRHLFWESLPPPAVFHLRVSSSKAGSRSHFSMAIFVSFSASLVKLLSARFICRQQQGKEAGESHGYVCIGGTGARGAAYLGAPELSLVRRMQTLITGVGRVNECCQGLRTLCCRRHGEFGTMHEKSILIRVHRF